MSRILGLDLGAKRIGVAVSDPTKTIAQGLNPLRRDRRGLWIEHLGHLVAEYQVTEVVAGLPRNMNGTEGQAATEVRSLAEILRAKLKVPVVFWDERLTTVAAQRMFQETGVKMRRAKGRMDTVAATLILQGYLNHMAKTKAGN